MGSFLELIVQGVLSLLWWAIIIWAVMSWLFAFQVINYRHPVVRQIERVLEAIVRPVLRPIQRIVPTLGTVDISPIIALLIISAAQAALVPWIFRPIIAALGG
jgi:YggT family protein